MTYALLFIVGFTCVGIALSETRSVRISLMVALVLLLIVVYYFREPEVITGRLPQIKPLQSTVAAIDKLRDITYSYP
jgi:uncharacterized membrane protein